MTKTEKFIIGADFQIPYHDEDALDIFLQYIEQEQPDKVILLGDILDLPQLTTKFVKEADLTSVKFDIACLQRYVDEIQKHTGEIVYVFGNHEDRWRRYVLENARELIGFSDITLQAQIDRPDIRYEEPWDTAYIHKSFHFKHGSRHNKYVAANELHHEGSSGMSGHKHTAQSFAHTDRKGAHAWYIVPCLCITGGEDAPPGYESGRNSIRDWTQGFSTVMFADVPGKYHEEVDVEMRRITGYQEINSIFNVYTTIITNGACVTPDGAVLTSRRTEE